jgi:hypothetical protein
LIIVHQDDGCLHLYATPEAVALAIEALDAEDTLLAVFDDDGQRYVIAWIRANQKGWFGISNGEYRLVPSGPPDRSALINLIRSVARVFPASHIASLDAILRKLESGGADHG